VTAVRIPYDVINTRLLAPIYPALILLGACLVRGAYCDPAASPVGRFGIFVAVLTLMAINTGASARYAFGPREDRGLSWPYWRSIVVAEPGWQHEPALSLLKTLPAGSQVLSNIWEIVSLHVGLPAKPLPPRAGATYRSDLRAHAGAYVLVVPGLHGDQIGVAEMSGLVSAGSVRLVAQSGEARLYRISDAPSP
jgi:hypothetical protein